MPGALTGRIVESARWGRGATPTPSRAGATGELWTAGTARWSSTRSPGAEAGRDTSRQRRPKGTPKSPSASLAAERARDGADFAPEVERRLRTAAGRRDTRISPTSTLDLELVHAVPACGDRRLRGPCRAARSSPTASWPRSPAFRARRGQPAPVCATNRFWLLVPCHRVVGATGLGGYGASGTALKQRLLELEGSPGCRSLRSSGTSSPRSPPARRCDRVAELSALFHTAGSAHLRGRGESPSTSTWPARAWLGVRSRSSATSASARRSAPIASAPSTGPRATSSTSPATRAALEPAARGGRARLRAASARAPPKPRRRAGCCRGAYLRGALLGAGSFSGPRSPHLEIRTASLEGAALPAVDRRQAGRHRHRVIDRPSPRRRSTPRARTRSRGCCSPPAPTGRVLALRGAVRAGRDSRPREPPRQRGSRQPRPHEPRRAGAARRRAPPRGRRQPRRGCRIGCSEAGRLRLRHPTLSLAELARRADPPATKAGMHRRLSALRQLADRKRAWRFSLAKPMTERGGLDVTLPWAGPRSSGDGFRPRPSSRSGARFRGGGGRPRSSPSGPPVLHRPRVGSRRAEPGSAAALGPLAAPGSPGLG